ncbi:MULTISPECIES: hypothetical protein [Gemella]|uniref:hypothetical protein n=1 Tax=Gemella TaxID=1378 RepID=UPI0007680107|nr:MULTISPECIES: hypothetical protein [Gemella]AME09690.1 hypothetical protein AXE85_05750 [Gemella sp. oral taxon 928]
MKLHRGTNNAVYLSIITTSVFALMASNIEWGTILAVSLFTAMAWAYIFDKRIDNFFPESDVE